MTVQSRPVIAKRRTEGMGTRRSPDGSQNNNNDLDLEKKRSKGKYGEGVMGAMRILWGAYDGCNDWGGKAKRSFDKLQSNTRMK
jgi:hypothetical protein